MAEFSHIAWIDPADSDHLYLDAAQAQADDRALLQPFTGECGIAAPIRRV